MVVLSVGLIADSMVGSIWYFIVGGKLCGGKLSAIGLVSCEVIARHTRRNHDESPCVFRPILSCSDRQGL